MEKILKNKTILIVIMVVIIVIIAVIIMNVIKNNNSKLTELEELKLKEVSNDVMNYMEVIDNSESSEIDRYIIYALLYSYNENNINTLTSKEIIDLIKNKFTIELNKDEMSKIGITPEMLHKNITYDPIADKFTINEYKPTYADIAATEIVKYNLTSIKKQKNEYIISYDKYVVKNPYEILNYYMDKNNEMMNATRDEETGEVIENANYELFDTSEIDSYLRGKVKVGVIKKYIVEENFSRVAEKKESIKVVYVLKDDKVLIDRIEK